MHLIASVRGDAGAEGVVADVVDDDALWVLRLGHPEGFVPLATAAVEGRA